MDQGLLYQTALFVILIVTLTVLPFVFLVSGVLLLRRILLRKQQAARLAEHHAAAQRNAESRTR